MTLLGYYNLICTENWIIPLVHEGSVIKEKIGRWNLPASKVVLWDQIEQNPNATSFTPALETDESLVLSSFGKKKLLISPCLFGTIQHWCIRRAGRLNKTSTVYFRQTGITCDIEVCFLRQKHVTLGRRVSKSVIRTIENSAF